MYPSAAGQYHWVAVMAPLNQRLVASWFTAWICIGGQVMLTASAAFAGGLQLQSLITLNNLDTYTPQRWQGMLFYDLVLLYSLIINVYGVKILPHANSFSGTLSIHEALSLRQVLIVSRCPSRSRFPGPIDCALCPCAQAQRSFCLCRIDQLDGVVQQWCCLAHRIALHDIQYARLRRSNSLV